MTKNKSQILTIHREGIPQRENAVRVTTPHAEQFWINPAAEVHRATGVRVSRKGCIVSFAEGLIRAGHSVYMDQNFIGKNRYVAQHLSTHEVQPLFLFVGIASGNRMWNQVMASLQNHTAFVDLRMFVLEFTAQYFARLPKGHKDLKNPRLIIPKNISS